jgi:hypothetical protein
MNNAPPSDKNKENEQKTTTVSSENQQAKPIPQTTVTNLQQGSSLFQPPAKPGLNLRMASLGVNDPNVNNLPVGTIKSTSGTNTAQSNCTFGGNRLESTSGFIGASNQNNQTTILNDLPKKKQPLQDNRPAGFGLQDRGTQSGMTFGSNNQNNNVGTVTNQNSLFPPKPNVATFGNFQQPIDANQVAGSTFNLNGTGENLRPQSGGLFGNTSSFNNTSLCGNTVNLANAPATTFGQTEIGTTTGGLFGATGGCFNTTSTNTGQTGLFNAGASVPTTGTLNFGGLGSNGGLGGTGGLGTGGFGNGGLGAGGPNSLFFNPPLFGGGYGHPPHQHRPGLFGCSCYHCTYYRQYPHYGNYFNNNNPITLNFTINTKSGLFQESILKNQPLTLHFNINLN